jgi:DNA polymerase-3 subunit alpha
MGKKIKSEMAAQRDLFVTGAIKNGVNKTVAIQVFEQMAKFAGYGFNKSHSAPYALLTYQTAYLKANYPLEFFAATMTYDMHNTDKLNIYRQDLLRAGIPLLPPDINHSMATFSVEENGIRYALSAIKNVGLQAMESLVEERAKNGPFKDLVDFITRLDGKTVNKRQLENLIAAGALDGLLPAHNFKRSQVFQAVDILLSQNQLNRQEKNNKQALLFSAQVHPSVSLTLPTTADWGLLETLEKEFNALGFYQSAHPLDIYKDSLSSLDLTNSYDLTEKINPGLSTVRLAGIILAKQERASKTGQKFAFVTLSDTSGVFEVAFFSEVYSQARDLLDIGTAIYIIASLRVEGDGYRLTAQSVELLENKTQNQAVVIEATGKLNVSALKAFLESCPAGKSKVEISLKLPSLPSVKITLANRYELTADHRSRLLVICS